MCRSASRALAPLRRNLFFYFFLQKEGAHSQKSILSLTRRPHAFTRQSDWLMALFLTRAVVETCSFWAKKSEPASIAAGVFRGGKR